MKKTISMILALAMMLCLLTSFACADDEYAEHMDFSATFQEFGTVKGTDAVYDYFCDKFNIDVEMIPVSGDSFDEKNTIMINGGTMTDWMMTFLDYGAYCTYAEQGMLKPLPEDWETRWPNIANMVEKSGMAEAIKIDGVTYCIPKAIFCNYVDGVALVHHTLYYRADWAKELGFEFGDTITVSELLAYCKAAVEKDMAGNGQTIGLEAGINTGKSYTIEAFMNMYNTQYGDFIKTENGYIWGPTMDSTLEGIKFIRECYQSGAVDPDFYLRTDSDAGTVFAAGGAAALFSQGTVGDYELFLTNATSGGLENAKEKISVAVLTDDEGVWHGKQADNYCWETVFSPSISDEKLERALDLMDYLATDEAQRVINMGLKDIDWEETDAGELKMITEGDIKEKYSSIFFWWVSSILPDEFSLVSPARDAYVRERINAMYATRSASNSYTATDADYKFFNGEAKNAFSVNVDDEIMRLVVEANLTDEALEKEWANYIDTNEPLWRPVIDELNAAFVG